MPTDVPIAPEHHARFARVSNRLLASSVITYVFGLSLVPFPTPRWIIIPCALITASVPLLATIRPKSWWRSLGLTKNHRAVLPDPLSIRFAICAALAGVSFLVPIWAIGRDPDLPLILALPFLVTGGTLTYNALRGREICPPSCPDCSYPMSGLDFPTPCPECGNRLGSIEETAMTTHVHRPDRLWLGMVLLAVGAATAAFVPLERHHVVAQLPASLRLTFAATDHDSFRTLDHDALTSQEHAQLCDSILDRRQAGRNYRITSQLNWLADQFASGRLTHEQGERFITEGTLLQINTLKPAHAGQPMPLIFTIDTEGSRIGPVTRWCFVRSLLLNGEILLHQDNSPRLPAFVHTPLSTLFLPDISLPEPRSLYMVNAPDTGTAVVHLTLIMVATPANAVPTITWHADGTYTITPPPLTTHERTTETTITITE